MNAVKKNVDHVEESVITAEKELGSHTIKKVLGSIPGLRQARNPLFISFFPNDFVLLFPLFSSFFLDKVITASLGIYVS